MKYFTLADPESGEPFTNAQYEKSEESQKEARRSVGASKLLDSSWPLRRRLNYLIVRDFRPSLHSYQTKPFTHLSAPPYTSLLQPHLCLPPPLHPPILAPPPHHVPHPLVAPCHALPYSPPFSIHCSFASSVPTCLLLSPRLLPPPRSPSPTPHPPQREMPIWTDALTAPLRQSSSRNRMTMLLVWDLYACLIALVLYVAMYYLAMRVRTNRNSSAGSSHVGVGKGGGRGVGVRGEAE